MRKYDKTKKTSKIIIRYVVVSLALTMALGNLPKVLLAATMNEQITEEKPVPVFLNKAEASPQLKIEEIDAAKDNAAKDNMDGDSKSNDDTYTGVDLSNDPNIIAELKEIYGEEDYKKALYGERKKVTMPNVVGMTEAEAVKVMRAAGVLPRVVYQDCYEGEEGRCFIQDIPAGSYAYTNTGYFIWIKHKENTSGDSIVQKEPEAVSEAAKTYDEIKQPEASEQTAPAEPEGESPMATEASTPNPEQQTETAPQNMNN